jgi:hypothetical protein
VDRIVKADKKLLTNLLRCLGQPEKALGHEPQIDPWLTPYNRRACEFPRLIGVVATKMRKQLRWNKAKPKSNRGREQTEHLAPRTGAGSQGKFLHFRSREKFLLDIPFYRAGVLTSLRRLFDGNQG